MGKPQDELFAKKAIQLKKLSPAQVMECRELLAELESAGIEKSLAALAVEQGLITKADVALISNPQAASGKQQPAISKPQPAAAAAGSPKPVARKAEPEAPKPELRKPKVAAKPPARPVKAPPPASKKVLFIALGAAALVVVAILAVVLGDGKKTEAPPVAKKTEVPPPAPVPPPVPVPEKKELPPPPPVPAPSVPVPALVPAPAPDGKKEFEERQAERKKDGQARLDEVKKEIAEERKAAEEAVRAQQARLAGRKVTLALLSGETLKDAQIESFNVYGAELQVDGKPSRITWEAVQPASLPAAADALFDPQKPADQFERGRFFVARRLWKDAQAAFSAAAKLGNGYESRVLEFSEVLERLASGQGGFRGSARRIGRDGVRLSWDFRDSKQLEDFTPGLKLAAGSATLEAAKRTAVYLVGGTSSGSGDAPLAFQGELSAELKLQSDDAVVFHLFAGSGVRYEIELGPAGCALVRIDPSLPEKDRRKPVAKSDKGKPVAGKLRDVRLLAKYPRFRVAVDGQPALEAEDGPVSVTAAPPSGPFGFSLEKGKLRLEGPFALQGRAEPAELDRRINDTEVMVRRALDPDLEQIEKFRARKKAMTLLGEARDLALSSDDPYFAFRIKVFADITRYEELKKQLATGEGPRKAEQWLADLGALIEKYPDVPSLPYLRALFREGGQDIVGALADVERALAAFPAFHEALALRAEIAMMMGDSENSIGLLKKALDARPDFVEGYILRARAAHAGNPGSQAFLEDLEIARKLDPQDSQAVTVQRMLKYAQRGPRELGCRFDHQTSHYAITTDISLEAAKRYGENLEAAFRHYQDSFKGPSTRPGVRKPRVAIFNTAENYYTYFELLSEDRGENTLGVFRANLNELVLFESTDLADTNHTLYHEAVHQYMTVLTERTPPFWYNEGIAEYMGAIRIQDGKVVQKGMLLRDRLPYVQLAIEVKADLPFKDIMNETPREFYSGNVGLKYAQAWSMIHFFYEAADGKHRPLIEGYFKALRAGRTPLEAYEGAFAAKVDELQAEWRKFTAGLK